MHSCGLALALAIGGCAPAPPPPLYFEHTSSYPPAEPVVDGRGNPLSVPELLPDGRWVKKVDLRSEPWGGRIMLDGFYVGETPMLVAIPCSPSGRFRRTMRLRLIPTEVGGRVHALYFSAGSPVPSRLYFSATESVENEH
jgi:hypothetical protein